MASSSAQKLKALHLMDILRTETDPEHGLTMPQLIERLAARGIDAERKGIYRDIETLREFGDRVEVQKLLCASREERVIGMRARYLRRLLVAA